VYIHIGTNVLLRSTELIAIIGRKGDFDKNKINKRYLRLKQNEGKVIDLSSNNAKSFILANDDRVYISPISPKTLKIRSRRIEKSIEISEEAKKIDC